MTNDTQKVNITGVLISNLSLNELLNTVLTLIKKDGSSIMLSGNVHSINLAHKLSWFKKMMNNADIVRNDSAGVQLAGKILGTSIKDRITWADFGWDLAAFCEELDLSLYFLGNKPGIPEKAKFQLQQKHPNLQVVGTQHGYFKKVGKENNLIVNEINNKKPDILIVGFGIPEQESWIMENHTKLDTGIIMTGGNCFTFLAGEETRAPSWMHINGLEWLYRFFKEPIRMFERYIIGNPLFITRVVLQKFGKKYDQ